MKFVPALIIALFSLGFTSCGDIQESNQHLNSMDSNIFKMREELASTREELAQMTLAMRETAHALQSLQVLASSLSTSFLTALTQPMNAQDFPTTDEVVKDLETPSKETP